MADSRRRAKGRRESGGFIALPHSVLRHPNYVSLSPRAVKLLLDFCSFYNGKNNGNFTTAWTVIKVRGWKSRDQVFKAQQELEEKGFILKTRQGGRHLCNLFAITFYAIDECDGILEVAATNVPPGDWMKN